MEPRLKFDELAPEGLARMRELEHYLNSQTGLEATLQELVRLLASTMNGCAYCVGLHTSELKRHNETADRIAEVTGWRVNDLYTHRERAAFGWTEAVTNIQEGHSPDAVYAEVKAHFGDVEIVNLTLTITTINAWNRLAISLGAHSRRG